jgi:hypothetical protein
MFYGVAIGSFAFFHTVITLVALVAGLLTLFAMLRNDRANTMTAVFLLFGALTAITGFLLPFQSATQPSMVVGYILSVAVLLAVLGRYLFSVRGVWRPVYVVAAVLSLYLNSFVFVTQTFIKVPALHAIAPGTPPAGTVFTAVQGLVLLFYIATGYLSVRRFKPRM